LDDDNPYIDESLADDDILTANHLDGIRAKLASQRIVHEPSLFSATISDLATYIHGLGELNDLDKSSCEVIKSKFNGVNMTWLTLTEIASIWLYILYEEERWKRTKLDTWSVLHLSQLWTALVIAIWRLCQCLSVMRWHKIPLRGAIATGFCCTDRWSYGPYYLLKLRWADPEGLVDQGWPQNSDSTTTSLASVVSCESTWIGSKESCLD